MPLGQEQQPLGMRLPGRAGMPQLPQRRPIPQPIAAVEAISIPGLTVDIAKDAGVAKAAGMVGGAVGGLPGAAAATATAYLTNMLLDKLFGGGDPAQVIPVAQQDNSAALQQILMQALQQRSQQGQQPQNTEASRDVGTFLSQLGLL